MVKKATFTPTTVEMGKNRYDYPLRLWMQVDKKYALAILLILPSFKSENFFELLSPFCFFLCKLLYLEHLLGLTS